jgi:hypothetical protein
MSHISLLLKVKVLGHLVIITTIRRRKARGEEGGRFIEKFVVQVLLHVSHYILSMEFTSWQNYDNKVVLITVI